jgi:hypothetical protein
MEYTRRKIRGINFSFLLAGLVFAGWAFVCAWFGWPRGFRHASAAGFGLFAMAAVFFCAFPIIWARFPEKHPVNHELARYGDFRQVAQRLDREMAEHFEAIGPFRFTAAFLTYDSGHEFQIIPYDQVASAEVLSDDIPGVVVRTRRGRRYQWYRTWMQGTFDPARVLEKIRAFALVDAGPAVASDHPAPATQSPSTTDSPGSAQSLQ